MFRRRSAFLVSRVPRRSASSRRNLVILAWMRRRSVSSLVSPGPRPPMPPPPAARPPAWRDRLPPQPRRRWVWYCNWASSTCALPSALLACWAKMSRISATRSTTLTLTRSSRLRSWLGASSPSQMTVSAPVAAPASRSSSTLPLPMKVAGSGFCRRWTSASRTSEPAVSASAASSAREFSASSAVPSVQTPTRTTRSRRNWRYSTSEMSSSSVDRPATRRRDDRASRSRVPVSWSGRSRRSSVTRATPSCRRRRSRRDR